MYKDFLFWDLYDYGCYRHIGRLERAILHVTRWPRFVWWVLDIKVRQIICRLFDHSLVWDHDVGPDSGSEWCECSRCGYYWQHRYY